MGFDDILKQSLENPDSTREKFVNDLRVISKTNMGVRDEARKRQMLPFDLSQLTRTSGSQGYGFLQNGPTVGWPVQRPPRFDDGTTNSTGYMLDAIKRDNALAQYDQAQVARGTRPTSRGGR